MPQLMPHGACVLWNVPMLSTYVASNLAIALSYYSITATLFFMLPFIVVRVARVVIIMFGWFILACGTTHVLDVITVWLPWYWGQTGVLVATAAPSIMTAVYVRRMRVEFMRAAIEKLPA